MMPWWFWPLAIIWSLPILAVAGVVLYCVREGWSHRAKRRQVERFMVGDEHPVCVDSTEPWHSNPMRPGRRGS